MIIYIINVERDMKKNKYTQERVWVCSRHLIKAGDLDSRLARTRA